jgi:hypothetical protein
MYSGRDTVPVARRYRAGPQQAGLDMDIQREAV